MLLALLLVYAIAIPADSGALTSGMTLSAQPEFRGATMAHAFHHRLRTVGRRRLGHRRGARCLNQSGNVTYNHGLISPNNYKDAVGKQVPTNAPRTYPVTGLGDAGLR